MTTQDDESRFSAAVAQLQDLLAGIGLLRPLVLEAAERVDEAFRKGGKLLLFGNGGSATQAQHIAAEFTNRFLRDRRALPAIALTADSAVLTCVANDSSFERVFARQIEALGRPGDIAIGLSTSGRSGNVVAALEAARKLGVCTIGLTGRSGAVLAPHVDLLIRVDSESTPRIQEIHLLIGHLLAEIVEARC